MKLTAYPSYPDAAALHPASKERAWLRAREESHAGLARSRANGLGIDLLCPHAFEATWHGGPDAADVDLSFDGDTPARAFVQSLRGEGLLTFHPGHQFKTDGGKALWVRGPVNAPKDGIAALEIIIDPSMVPGTFTMHWKFTRPGQTVRFEAGEPFCTVLPYAKDELEPVEVEVVEGDGDGDGDGEAGGAAFLRMIDESAVAKVFEHLGGTAAQSDPDSEPSDSEPSVTAVGTASSLLDEIPFPPPFHVIAPPRALPAQRVKELFRGDYPSPISVILPATNESVLLRRTVEQFAATLPAGGEVIVVDNGSTDGCADFLASQPFDNVRLIRTPEPLGVAVARNRGLAAARGEVVVFADAHIDVPERWWQPLVSTLDRPNVGVVGPAIGVMGKPERPASCGQRIAESRLRLEWLPRNGDQPCAVPCLGGGFMAMRHDILKRAGAFDAGMPQWGSEDMELCLRYWLLGLEVWVAPEVTVLHYFRKVQAYKVESRSMIHNLLRTALLHFSQARIGRVMTALRNHARFGPALALAVDSDVWQKRAEFAQCRVRDDDWLFEKFADCCRV